MRFVLCDDHRLFVEPFAGALATRGHDVIVTTRPTQAVRAVDRHRPDMVVVDLSFPEGDGISLVRAVLRRHPSCSVVVLSGTATTDDEVAAIAAGAIAILRKDQPIRAHFAAFDRIAAGLRVAPLPLPRRAREMEETVRVRKILARLTERERQVLDHLLVADDTRRIARSLGVAPSTTRTHVQNVLLKLGVHNRLQAVALILGSGTAEELAGPCENPLML